MTRQLLAASLMAAFAYIPRALPIVLVKNKLNSKFVKSFLFYVPYAVLGAMIFPSILYSTSSLPSAIMGLIVAIALAFFDKKLLTVAIGAMLSVYIWELSQGMM